MSGFLLLPLLVLGALAVAGSILIVQGLIRRRQKPPLDAAPPPTSLSILAGFSFFSGLGATALVVTAVILVAVLSMEGVLQVGPDARPSISMAAKIVLYASLLPSVAAIAFALAARGVISEGGGAVRGRPLYRTGVLLAVLSGAVVLDARVINPATWASVGAIDALRNGLVNEREINRGYLGVETGPIDSMGCIPLRRVVPGSPADRAGLKAGDLLVKIDGTNVYMLPPLGKATDPSYSRGSTEAYIERYIGTVKPGSMVAIQVRRGGQTLLLVAELSASFDSLLKLLEDQSFDDERLAILKAAGLDHRYSADELTKICETFVFDDGRLKAIQPALPFLQDPQNAYRILGALVFKDAKSKVSGWITATPKPPKEE